MEPVQTQRQPGFPRSGLCRICQFSSEIRKRLNGTCGLVAYEDIRVLLLVSSIKLIAEIALMALVGQGLLGLLAGRRRDTNLFYQLLGMLTKPFIRGARLITPKLVLDRHLPLVAFLLLAFAWVVATMSKISICLQSGENLCR